MPPESRQSRLAGNRGGVAQSDSFVTILTVTLQLLQDQEQFAKSEFGQDLANKERRSQCQKSRAKKRRKPISKHRPHGQSPKQVTEEAFAKARQRMPLSFWLHLIGVLLERFEAEHAERMRFRGFRLLAMDGTRLTLPDEKALRNFYGTASNGKGKHNAQARMVLLQSPLTRLPLAYQLEPVKVGEVTMARRLASGLRPTIWSCSIPAIRAMACFGIFNAVGPFFVCGCKAP